MVDDNPQTKHDPQNPAVRYGNNLITVPGKTPKPWEISAVPHGTLTWHTYRTKIVLGLPENRSSYLVYTPPGYDFRKTVRYPVLYLLHCWGDRPDSWNKFDQASIIFDNLIAAKRMKPMIVVMPLGYGDMQFSKKYLWDQPAAVLHNLNLFSEAFLKEVMPDVERQYSISANRKDRAIIGASMGGLESLTIGLNHTNKFAWIGGISSAVDNLDFIEHFSSFHAATADLSLLWIACGTGDDLITSNQRLISWISRQQIPVTTANGPGLHSYIFWRESLIQFAVLLFQGK
jgi:enterochelin esterase family protein